MEYYWELRSKNTQNIKALMCPLYYRTLHKDYNMYPQPPPFRKLLYLQMQNESTDYYCQNFFENQG